MDTTSTSICPPHSEIPGFIRKHKRTILHNVSYLLKYSGVPRKSRLSAPIERLEDHNAEVLTCEFHPHGQLIMSGGMRRQIHICSVYGEGGNVMILKGHGGAIMEAHFSTDGSKIYSAASDGAIMEWDTFTGIKITHLKGYEDCVNTVQVARKGLHVLCSGGDDAMVRVWDVRQQVNAMTFENSYNVTATCFNKTGEHIFTGSFEPYINIWDIRQCDVVLRLQGHKDAVTGLALSPCGSYLLSHSTDSTLRIWDIRPSFMGQRCLQVFNSNQYVVNGNLLRCAWSPDGNMVSAGSSDEGVPLWIRNTGVKLTELPGHEASINDVCFHPNEPIIASASSDEYLFLHEITY